MVNPSSIAQSSSPWNAPEDQDGELSSWTRFIFNNIVIPAGCVFLMMLFFGVLEALFSREDRSSSSGNTGSSVVNHFHVPPNSAAHFHCDTTSGTVTPGQVEPQNGTTGQQPGSSSISNASGDDNGNTQQ